MACCQTPYRHLLQLALWVLLWDIGVRGQAESPLRGQGLPHSSTTDVYVSVYLERLLKVDENDYMHECILYFYITWTDESRTASQKSECKRYCNNNIPGGYCCDELYLPSFYFRNAYGFPQDRKVFSEILFGTSTPTVAWATTVHGIYYQPMEFSKFPLDSIDLLVELQFMDIFDNITAHFSSGGTKLYSLGKGDDTAEWGVKGISLEVKRVDIGKYYLVNSPIPSHDQDPLPLNVKKPAVCNFFRLGDKACNVFSGVPGNLFLVKIRVERFGNYHLINSLLPVLLCALLGFIPFFLDLTDLTTRLELTVTLFLSLTAIQFVLVDKQPMTSYVIPTQQLVICTYVLLAVVAIESITAFHVATWNQHRAAKRKRKEGYYRYLEVKRNGGVLPTTSTKLDPDSEDDPLDADSTSPAPGGVEGKEGGAPPRTPDSPRIRVGTPSLSSHPFPPGTRTSPSPGGQNASECGSGGSVAGTPEKTDEPSPSQPTNHHTPNWQHMAKMAPSWFAQLTPREGGRKGGRFARWWSSISGSFKGVSASKINRARAASFQHLKEDEAYAEYLAHMMDVYSASFCLVGYCLAVILIFALHNGYVDLFSD